MRKKITWMDGSEERSLELDNTFTWMVYYKEAFGHDIVPDLAPILNTIIKGFFAVFSAVDIKKIVDAATTKQKGKSETDRAAAIMDEIMHKVDPIDLTDVVYEATAIEGTTMLQIMWALAKCADDSVGDFTEWTRTTSGMTPDTLVMEIFDLVLKGWITENPLVKRLLTTMTEPTKK